MIIAILILCIVWVVPIVISLLIKKWYNSLPDYDIDEVFYFLASGEEPKVRSKKSGKKR